MEKPGSHHLNRMTTVSVPQWDSWQLCPGRGLWGGRSNLNPVVRDHTPSLGDGLPKHWLLPSKISRWQDREGEKCLKPTKTRVVAAKGNMRSRMESWTTSTFLIAKKDVSRTTGKILLKSVDLDKNTVPKWLSWFGSLCKRMSSLSENTYWTASATYSRMVQNHKKICKFYTCKTYKPIHIHTRVRACVRSSAWGRWGDHVWWNSSDWGTSRSPASLNRVLAFKTNLPAPPQKQTNKQKAPNELEM